MAETGGCARPTGKVLGQQPDDPINQDNNNSVKEEKKMSIMVGQKAPDFEAPAYFKGEFTSVKLSEALGHWALLCFYPGDFTFV